MVQYNMIIHIRSLEINENMQVCIYKYKIYTCIQIYMKRHKYAYIHKHKHTYIHASIHTCIYTYIHLYIHASIHTFIYTYMHAYIHTYIAVIYTPTFTQSSNILGVLYCHWDHFHNNTFVQHIALFMLSIYLSIYLSICMYKSKILLHYQFLSISLLQPSY